MLLLLFVRYLYLILNLKHEALCTYDQKTFNLPQPNQYLTAFAERTKRKIFHVL